MGAWVDEFDCKRCGIRLVHVVALPRDRGLCLLCAWCESIKDPAARAQAEEFLASIGHPRKADPPGEEGPGEGKEAKG